MPDPANMSLDEIIQAARDNARRKARGGARGGGSTRGRGGYRGNRGQQRGGSRGSRNAVAEPSTSSPVVSNRRGRVVLKRLARNRPKPIRYFEEGAGERQFRGRGGRGRRRIALTVGSRARPRSSGYSGRTLVFSSSRNNANARSPSLSSQASGNANRARGRRGQGRGRGGSTRGGARGSARGGVQSRLGFASEERGAVGNGRRTTGASRNAVTSEARARLALRLANAKVRRAKELLRAKALKRAAALLVKARASVNPERTTNFTTNRSNVKRIDANGRALRAVGSGNVLISVPGPSSAVSRPTTSSIIRSQPRGGFTFSVTNDRVKLTTQSSSSSFNRASSRTNLSVTVPSSSARMASTSTSTSPVKHVQDLDPIIQKHIASIKTSRAERTKQKEKEIGAPSCDVSAALVRQIAAGSSKRLCDRFASL